MQHLHLHLHRHSSILEIHDIHDTSRALDTKPAALNATSGVALVIRFSFMRRVPIARIA